MFLVKSDFLSNSHGENVKSQLTVSRNWGNPLNNGENMLTEIEIHALERGNFSGHSLLSGESGNESVRIKRYFHLVNGKVTANVHIPNRNTYFSFFLKISLDFSYFTVISVVPFNEVVRSIWNSRLELFTQF